MSALHMFLPVSEPARSETLAQLLKTHHIPRHLVRGIALRKQAEREAAARLIGPLPQPQMLAGQPGAGSIAPK